MILDDLAFLFYNLIAMLIHYNQSKIKLTQIVDCGYETVFQAAHLMSLQAMPCMEKITKF